MKKLIIEIDEQCYKQVINDPEWDTLADVLAFAIYFKEVLKESKPLQTEFEEIKAEIDGLYSDCLYGEQLVSKPETMQIIDNHIKELKGE